MAVRNSKALIGALFIQYIFFGFFYILDELFNIAPNHYRAINNKELAASRVKDSEPAPVDSQGKGKKSKASHGT